MAEIPEDYALDGIVSAEAFADEAYRLGRQAVVLSATIITVVVALLIFGSVLDSPGLPSLSLLLKSFDESATRAMSDDEDIRLMMSWAVMIAAGVGLAVIRHRYRRHLRYGSTARYCQLLGLYYILDWRVRRQFAGHRFAALGLVPEHHAVKLDDLVGWGSASDTLVFAEVRLLKRIPLQKYAEQVFRGSLLFVEAKTASKALGGREPVRLQFERNAAGTWRAGDSFVIGAPGVREILDRVAALATCLEATEVHSRLADDGFHVAMAHSREALPIPPFWRRDVDRSTFTQLGLDLQALAALAHTLGPETEASRWFQSLPPQVSAR